MIPSDPSNAVNLVGLCPGIYFHRFQFRLYNHILRILLLAHILYIRPNAKRLHSTQRILSATKNLDLNSVSAGSDKICIISYADFEPWRKVSSRNNTSSVFRAFATLTFQKCSSILNNDIKWIAFNTLSGNQTCLQLTYQQGRRVSLSWLFWWLNQSDSSSG